jgi:hypothetical protein
MYKNLKISFLCALGSLLALGAFSQPTFAQNGQLQQTTNQTSWGDSLRLARAENEALSHILAAIESIDTARQNELIQWIITDRNIRSRVVSALRKAGRNISPNSVAELTVTQKPPTSSDPDMQLLRLVIESIGVYGEPNIRRILGPDLYDRIRSRTGYEYTLISTEPAQQKIQFVYMDASLFGGQIIFKSGFGFAVRVGNDVIGYPFWLPGTIGTYGLLRRGTTDFRVGLEWPLGQSGIDAFAFNNAIKIRERKLMGTSAFAAQIEQGIDLFDEMSGKIHLGGEFFTAFSPTIETFPQFARAAQFRTQFPTSTALRNALGGGQKDSLFYLQLSAHGWITYKLPNRMLRGAYIQVGGGTHSVTAATIGPSAKTDPSQFLVRTTGTDTVTGQPILEFGNNTRFTNEVNVAKKYQFFDPLIKLGYVHTGDQGDEYGISVQYCNTLLADAFVKLFPWLQLEAKYSTVVGRDARKWEWKDYVMVSPKIIFNF